MSRRDLRTSEREWREGPRQTPRIGYVPAPRKPANPPRPLWRRLLAKVLP